MPFQKLSINYTRTIEGTYEIDVDVPQDVLDDGDKLHEWVEKNVSEGRIAANGDQEDDTLEITEVTDHGEA